MNREWLASGSPVWDGIASQPLLYKRHGKRRSRSRRSKEDAARHREAFRELSKLRWTPSPEEVMSEMTVDSARTHPLTADLAPGTRDLT